MFENIVRPAVENYMWFHQEFIPITHSERGADGHSSPKNTLKTQNIFVNLDLSVVEPINLNFSYFLQNPSIFLFIHFSNSSSEFHSPPSLSCIFIIIKFLVSKELFSADTSFFLNSFKRLFLTFYLKIKKKMYR